MSIRENKLTKRQTNKIKNGINTGRLSQRLQSYVYGKPVIEQCECGREHEVFKLDNAKKMEPGQVRAALGLMGFCLPKPTEIINNEPPKSNPEEKAELLVNIIINDKGPIKCKLKEKGYELRPILKQVSNS